MPELMANVPELLLLALVRLRVPVLLYACGAPVWEAVLVAFAGRFVGDPVEMLQLKPDGSGEVVVLGHDIAAGMRPQHVVPGGVWQGSRLRAGGGYALLGTTMSPGFDYSDYESGTRENLAKLYPQHTAMIASLTR